MNKVGNRYSSSVVREYIKENIGKKNIDEIVTHLRETTTLKVPSIERLYRDIKSERDREIREEIKARAIDTFGEDMQKIVAMEELAELQQALSKDLRGRDHNVEEEIADVYIMLMQLELMYDKKKIEEWIDKKIDRLDKRLRG
ncbi:hypothetical protein [Clostridium tertium]|uniref:hypothetical protein n=1 Tax=Clostridium tertium TaxID=1559 RepID=UPI001FD79762|nr:hypothetical protein [Clostridium tertium]MBP1868988.1 NTP pyrophosphatase (non-canonical NTP hydrolase) [Clostridium tertium]